MSSIASTHPPLVHAPGKSAVHKAALFFVWLAIATSGVVFAEPAPVDALLVGLVVLLPIVGLAPLSRPVLVHLGVWLLIAAAGCLSSLYAIELADANTHVFVTFYLSLASVVLLAFVMAEPVERVRLIMGAYLVAAVIATLAALIGYFNLVPPLTGLLTEFGRARGTFKDPNVYGAFLAPAIVYAVYLWHTGPGIRSLVPLLASGLMVLGVLLSFSRGAWANAALSLLVFGYLTFLLSGTARQRLRLVLVTAFGIVLAVGVVATALQFEEISELMAERAKLAQDYDTSESGRFAGHDRAKELILEYPLGIGARNFGGNYHDEDVHQVYLNMFLNHGWIGGTLYALLVAVTIVQGLRHCLKRSREQTLFIAIYAAFFGTAAEGFIIDTDHWRHFFFLLAMVWGMMLGAARQPVRTRAP